MGKALGYFLDINTLRNIDIYTYLTGIGNFWSRWLVTIKQTFDEVFINNKYCKFISYSLLLLLNVVIFSKSIYILFALPLFGLLIYTDFYNQEKNYYNSLFGAIFFKFCAFILLCVFWALCFYDNNVLIQLDDSFTSLQYFRNSDFLIFFIIVLFVFIHIIRRKISVIASREQKEFEDISLLGIVLLGYFVMMFGVF